MIEPETAVRLIIPPQEAERLVAGAGKVYLRDCPCRSEMQVCPRETWAVCMLFEHASPQDPQKAKRISPHEAVQIVRTTTERGDIHQVFYFEDGARPYELCNCCTCCCFPLRQARDKGSYAEQARCGYVPVTDPEKCIGCGLCVDSCFFEARLLEDGAIRLVDEYCFGYGRCVPACPERAIRLELQPARGTRIPGV